VSFPRKRESSSLLTSPRFGARATFYRHLGEYERALRDYQQGEALNPAEWAEGYRLLFQPDCHARLGDEAGALACLRGRQTIFGRREWRERHRAARPPSLASCRLLRLAYVESNHDVALFAM
jgi:tetratricopeptide (TPR) repeat protein